MLFTGVKFMAHLATAKQSGEVSAPRSVAAAFPALEPCASRYAVACSKMCGVVTYAGARGTGPPCWE